MVSLFLSYPMSLDIPKLAHWRGTGFRSIADERRGDQNGSRLLVAVRDQVLLAVCVSFFREFVVFLECLVVVG